MNLQGKTVHSGHQILSKFRKFVPFAVLIDSTYFYATILLCLLTARMILVFNVNYLCICSRLIEKSGV